jgi:hypothetical protein
VSWFSLEIRCGNPECGHQWDDIIPRRDVEEGNLPTCPLCGTTAVERVFAAPAIMQASLPDHVRRPGWKEKVESLKLESEAYSLPPEKRGDLLKEVHNLTKVKE